MGGEEGQPGTWPGLREAKPKRGREIGVGGDHAPSNLVFVKLRGRKIEGACPLGPFLFFFFFFFFFYIMYSLLRYKNSHAALAMA